MHGQLLTALPRVLDDGRVAHIVNRVVHIQFHKLTLASCVVREGLDFFLMP